MKLFKKARIILKESFSKAEIKNIIALAKLNYDKLLLLNKNEGKAKLKHLKNEILPAVALYNSLIKNKIERDSAIGIVGEAKNLISNDERKAMIILFKIPFLYKLYPTIFTRMQKKVFNEEAGFSYTYHVCSKKTSKFDMHKCFFYDTFTKYGVPELTRYFCHSDVLKNDGIHKNIIWHRDGTIGDGDSICDFEVRIK